MATMFANFVLGLEEEAQAEGPEAVAQLEVLRDRFRLGRQIAQARLEQKLSQRQVATRAKVDPGDISRIERGVANPTLATLSAVACAVGLEIDLKRRPGRRHGRGKWTPARLRKAVTAGTRAEKIAVLKKIGVLTSDGKLSKSSKRWGNRPSRTPVLED